MSSDNCNLWWFTFGQNHCHEVHGFRFDKDVVLQVEGSFGDARETMCRHFGTKWAMQYSAVPNGRLRLSLFPRGVVDIEGNSVSVPEAA